MLASDLETAWTAVRALLADPRATLTAIDERGLFCPLPAALSELAGGAEPLLGRTALDVVLPSEAGRVIEAWDQVTRVGAAALIVHLRDDPSGAAWVLHMVDLRERCGTHLAVCVPASGVARPEELAPAETPTRPRLARVVKDQVAVITEIDQALTLLLGWTAAELVGHRSSEFVHPDDQELAIASWIEMLGAPGLGRRVRLRHARRDGTWAWFELTNHNLLDTQGHVLCEMVDISEEMAAHEALRAREQLLHRLAEALPVAVVQTGADGRIAYTNAQVSGLLGPDAQDVEDLVRAFRRADAVRVRDCFGQVLAGAGAADVEGTLADETRHVSVSVRRLDEEGTTTGAVACFSDVTDGRRLREELQRRATVDPLTGVLNRSSVLEAVEAGLGGDGRGVAVVFVDLDGFKAVNDTLGHRAGDDLLCVVARVLQNSCRPGDAVGRLGGDEFLVTCVDVASPDEAQQVGRRFAAAVRGGDDGGVAASSGVAWSRPRATSARQLVAAADEAMYVAKARGDGQVVLAG